MGDWETVGDNLDANSLQRMRVPGGWLYRTFAWDYAKDEESGVALAFVPEPSPVPPEPSR